MSKGVPTRKEFDEMAARGRVHKEDNTVIPSDFDSKTYNLRSIWVASTATPKTTLRTFTMSVAAGHDIAYTEYVQDLEQAKVPPTPKQLVRDAP